MIWCSLCLSILFSYHKVTNETPKLNWLFIFPNLIKLLNKSMTTTKTTKNHKKCWNMMNAKSQREFHIYISLFLFKNIFFYHSARMRVYICFVFIVDQCFMRDIQMIFTGTVTTFLFYFLLFMLIVIRMASNIFISYLSVAFP